MRHTFQMTCQVWEARTNLAEGCWSLLQPPPEHSRSCFALGFLPWGATGITMRQTRCGGKGTHLMTPSLHPSIALFSWFMWVKYISPLFNKTGIQPEWNHLPEFVYIWLSTESVYQNLVPSTCSWGVLQPNESSLNTLNFYLKDRPLKAMVPYKNSRASQWFWHTRKFKSISWIILWKISVIERSN